jgi:holo-[acyl-carrier protein] synthase
MRIGVDMVGVSRIAHSLSVSSRFAPRVYSPREIEAAAQMPSCRAHEFLAGRFAVKEAVIKAMRAPLIDTVALSDIETAATEDGYPELYLYASALRVSQSLRVSHWQVSISHESGFAVAFVIAY